MNCINRTLYYEGTANVQHNSNRVGTKKTFTMFTISQKNNEFLNLFTPSDRKNVMCHIFSFLAKRFFFRQNATYAQNETLVLFVTVNCFCTCNEVHCALFCTHCTFPPLLKSPFKLFYWKMKLLISKIEAAIQGSDFFCLHNHLGRLSRFSYNMGAEVRYQVESGDSLILFRFWLANPAQHLNIGRGSVPT